MASVSLSDRLLILMVVASEPTLIPTAPPSSAALRLTALESRVVVPSCISAPARSASQVSEPSFRLPVRTRSTMLTLGSWPNGTMVTFMPLSRVKTVLSGS